MLNTSNRTVRWTGATVLVCVVIVVATWLLLIEPRRAAAADLHAQQASTQQANDLLRTRIEQLRSQYVLLPTTRARLAEIQRQLPTTADLASVLRTVDGFAAGAGLTLVSVSPGAGQSDTSTSATGGAASAGGTATSGTAAGSGTPTLVQIPLTIVVTGDYFQAVSFLRQLQTRAGRAVLITGLQMTQQDATTDSGVNLTVSAEVFVLATNVSATYGSTAGPSPSPTAGATTGSSASPTSTPTATSTTTATPSATRSGSVAAAELPAASASTGDTRW